MNAMQMLTTTTMMKVADLAEDCGRALVGGDPRLKKSFCHFN